MNTHALLVALFVILALAGCVQVPTGQGQAPVLFYPHDDEPDMRTGNMGM